MRDKIVIGMIITVIAAFIALLFLGAMMVADLAHKLNSAPKPAEEPPTMMVITKGLDDLKNSIPNVDYFSVRCMDWGEPVKDCSCTFRVTIGDVVNADFDGEGNTPGEACNAAAQGYRDFCKRAGND